MSFDMNKMLQQVQQMQAEMQKAQEELGQRVARCAHRWVRGREIVERAAA